LALWPLRPRRALWARWALLSAPAFPGRPSDQALQDIGDGLRARKETPIGEVVEAGVAKRVARLVVLDRREDQGLPVRTGVAAVEQVSDRLVAVGLERIDDGGAAARIGRGPVITDVESRAVGGPHHRRRLVTDRQG